MSGMSIEQFTVTWMEAMPRVKMFVGSMIPDIHEAEDVLQEVALVLLKKRESYDDSKSFLSWALGVARFEVLAARRRYARHPMLYTDRIVELIADACAEAGSELDRRQEALAQCLKELQLNRRTREVFMMRYDAGSPTQRIAECLGLSDGNVRVVLNRIRNALRDCIGKKLLTWSLETAT